MSDPSDSDTKPDSGTKGKPPRTPKSNTGTGSTKANMANKLQQATKRGKQAKSTQLGMKAAANKGGKALPSASKTVRKGGGTRPAATSNLRLSKTKVPVGTKRPSTAPPNTGQTKATTAKRAKRAQTAAQTGGAPATGAAGGTPATPPTTPPTPLNMAALTALLQSPDILARTIGALAQAQATQAHQLEEQRTMNQHFRALTSGTGTGDMDLPTARKTTNGMIQKRHALQRGRTSQWTLRSCPTSGQP